MRVLKPLDRDGYSKEPFIAYASQSYTIVSGAANNPLQVSIDIAHQPPENWISFQQNDFDVGYINESGVYAYQLFTFLNTSFYSSKSFVGYGTESVAITKFTPSGSLFVFNLANEAIGDGVKESTFSMQTSGSSTKILDDGYGRLYVNNVSNVVGNIFYKHGIAVIKSNVSATTQSISTNGLQIKEYIPLVVAFSSSTTIYENKIVCNIQPNEFNRSYYNPSLKFFNSVTGSYVSGATTVTYTDYELNYNPSSSATASSGESLYNLFESGSVTPYITTIGLYNGYELVAVAKLAQPIPRTLNVPQTFIVKFDT
jgi:hypothetical protein